MVDYATHNKIVFKKHPLQNLKVEAPVLDRQNVRLLSYNLFLRGMVKNVRDDWKDERLRAYVQMVDDYDIICNQEVFDFFNRSRKEQLITHCLKAGFIYYACSPPAPLFSEYWISGGLITFSRFPILENDFKCYRYGVLADQVSYKGVLYCKIDVSGGKLHVFQTHTQASYFGTSVEDFKITFECRLEQLRVIRRFIEEKTKNAHPNDLIILCGDINVNGSKTDRKGQAYRELVKEKPEFKSALDEYDREYQLMLEILSNNQQDQLTDVMRVSNNGHSPVTFGDCYIDADGIEQPVDKELVKHEDYCTQQSLDYIFEIKRAFNVEFEKNLLESGLSSAETADKHKSQNNISKTEQKRLIIDIKQSRVDKFLFDTHFAVKQCSDHYGVSTVLELV